MQLKAEVLGQLLFEETPPTLNTAAVWSISTVVTLNKMVNVTKTRRCLLSMLGQSTIIVLDIVPSRQS